MANDLPESQNGAASSSFDPDLLRVGQRLAGVYTLKKVIPMAMGESPIWIADDAISEREVSLHFIPQEVGTDPDVCEALRSEVRRCRQFIHPHILRVHDLADEPEFSAVVMDSFEGQTLARMLQENVKGFWEAEEIVPWLDSILHTLSDAHGIGLLHRDLSLHDIIVTQDDRVLISGFGITRVVTDALRRRGHVEDLALSYTSPQLLGNGFASVADDVYAVGACLFEMLTGQPLFEGRGVLDRIRGERPPAVMEARQRMGRTGELLYPNWEKVIAQCLAKEAGERPPSIAKLQERLGVRAETPEVSLAPSGSGAGAAVGGGGGASAKEGSIRERLLERAREHSQAPQHMGVAGEEEGPSEDGEARETVSFGQRRPLLTSPTTPMEREMRSRNGALLWFLLIAGGGAALWFGANAVVQRLKPKPQPVVPAPEPVRPEDPDKTLEGRFVPPAAPGTPPELTALRPGLPMRPRSGAAEDSGGVGGGVPLVSSEPAAPRLNPPARPVSPSPAPMPSAPSPASGGTVQSAPVPNAPSLPAKDAQAPAPDGAAPKADGQMENAQRLLDEAKARAAAAAKEYDRLRSKKELSASQRAALAAAKKEKEQAEKRVQELQAAIKELTQLLGNPELKEEVKPESKPAAKAEEKPPATQAPLAAGTIVASVPAPAPVSAPTPLEGAAKVLKQRADATPRPAGAQENSVGMLFLPVGDVMFSVFETRVKDYEAFVRETGYARRSEPSWDRPGFEQSPDDPVVAVSWNDASSFCTWLTDRERKLGLLNPGEHYRLPTDLEWSRAVGLSDERGKDPSVRDSALPEVYPWGNQWPPVIGAGNFLGTEGDTEMPIKGYADAFPQTAPVGSFKPNELGLYDLSGNVWEWCFDTFTKTARQRVLRGGSFKSSVRQTLWSSVRIFSMPEVSRDDYGFRVVRAGDGGKKR